MANTTNTRTTGARSASTSQVGAVRKPASASSAVPRRIPGTTPSTRSAGGTGVKRAAPGDDETSPSQMEDINAKLAAMAAMFDRERENTAARMASEQMERKKYEDKVLQLEENLEEQKRMAKEHKRDAGRRRTLFDDEMAQMKQMHAREKQMWMEDLERERQAVRSLKDSMVSNSTAHLTLESTNAALRTEVQSLQDQLRQRDVSIEEMTATLQAQKAAVVEIEGELRDAETLRRKLHNEIQELRGNIRVFTRVRPALPQQSSAALATIKFPNPKEAKALEVLSAGESAAGTATLRTMGFEFDRVFGPESTQLDVFEEVQHLMQSVLDGYNTCIFAYGQTGSGKTHTLEGSGLPTANYDDDTQNDASANTGAGLIPRAVQMLFATAASLKEKGWSYDFEGSMLEIYNETINDLLGKGKVCDDANGSGSSSKHEIKHEKGRTTVTDTVVLPLTSPSQVFSLLSRASSKRSVAATLMNERSSRSHSVFSLRVRGRNATTLESCDATLNLVDLAGSERLSSSGSGDDPRRLKEAVNINKSLSALADVITALGAAGNRGGNPGAPAAPSTAHIPYRNSTLTWLLKNSLGGNSKTLMLASLSPMLESLQETICTLRFATKVSSTFVGVARKVKGSD
ncbi:unnamed protein product [Jaminaea pallidilutea]